MPSHPLDLGAEPERPVIWLSPHLSAVPRSGGDLRTHRLLTAVAAKAPTQLLVFGPRVDTAAVTHATGVRSTRWFRGTRGARARSLALRRRWPTAASWTWDSEAEEVVLAAMSEGARLVCDHLYTAGYGVGRPHLLSLHNVESARVRELGWPEGIAPLADRAWSRLVLPRWEQERVTDPNARVIAVSRADADRLAGHASVVPNGADLVPARVAPRDGTLLFVGALDYAPNLDAVLWWSERIWPHMPTGSPPLTVVGRGGAQVRERLIGLPGLDVRGEVPDVAPELARAAVAVVPLRQGGGSRLKVLEALAWSIPVVATTKAVEGLDVTPGHDVLLADTPEGLATQLCALRENRRTSEQIGSAGRRTAEGYSWATIGNTFIEQLRASTDARGGDRE